MADPDDELDEQDEEDEDQARAGRRRRFGFTLASPLELLIRRLQLQVRSWLPWRMRVRRRRP